MSEPTVPLREQIARALHDAAYAHMGEDMPVFDTRSELVQSDFWQEADTALAVLAAQPQPEMGGIRDSVTNAYEAYAIARADGTEEHVAAFTTADINLLALISRAIARPDRGAVEEALDVYLATRDRYLSAEAGFEWPMLMSGWTLKPDVAAARAAVLALVFNEPENTSMYDEVGKW